LLNHAQIKGAEYARPNDNALLAILDLNTRQAGISLGYFSEMLVTEEEAYRILMAARPHLVNGEYGPAFRRLFHAMGRVLGRKARVLKRKPIELLREERLARAAGRLHLPVEGASLNGVEAHHQQSAAAPVAGGSQTVRTPAGVA